MNAARFGRLSRARVCVVAACGGNEPVAKHPAGAMGQSARCRSPRRSARTRTATPRRPSTSTCARSTTPRRRPTIPRSVAVAMAALDALVHRSVAAFADVAPTSALADRVDPATCSPRTAAAVDERLAKVLDDAEGPFAAASRRRGPARARRASRRHQGGSDVMRARTGCVREAAVLGPVAWTPVSSVTDADAARSRRNRGAERAARPGPFLPKVRAAKVKALGCNMPLYAESNSTACATSSSTSTCRKAGWIGLGLRASSAAVVRAGGQLAIDRPYSLGAGQVARFARLEADRRGHAARRRARRHGSGLRERSSSARGTRTASRSRARARRGSEGDRHHEARRPRRAAARRPPTRSVSPSPSARSRLARAARPRTFSTRSSRAPTRRPSCSSSTRAPCASRAISRR